MAVGLLCTIQTYVYDGGKKDNACKQSCFAKTVYKHPLTYIFTEAAIGVTAFVLGLLAVLSVVSMPAAAGYALLGVGSFILLCHVLYTPRLIMELAKERFCPTS